MPEAYTARPRLLSVVVGEAVEETQDLNPNESEDTIRDDTERGGGEG